MIPRPPRLDAEERLDGTGHDPGVLARSLDQVAAVDRWLGGARGVARALEEAGDELRAAVRAGGTLRLLDVGTGNGKVAVQTADRMAAIAGPHPHDGRRGESPDSVVRAVGLDLHPEIVRLAADTPGVDAVRGDALRLPFRADTFDVATVILTLHHFRDEDAVALLAELRRVARVRIVVSDLERTRLHWLGARALAATLWRSNPLTRHDGPISVLRGFAPAELERLAIRAGLREVRVRRILPWRIVLSGRP